MTQRIRSSSFAWLLAGCLGFASSSLPAAISLLPLGTGPEIPIRSTEAGQVPTEKRNLRVVDGTSTDLVFWNAGHDAALLVVAIDSGGAPPAAPRTLPVPETLRGANVVTGAETADGFLILIARPESALFAWTLDRQGNPTDEPRRTWDTGESGSLVGGPNRFLFVWTRGYSVRTLTLDSAGNPLHWSAPVEELAGSILSYDLFAVTDGYRILVDGHLACLDDQGRRIGDLEPVVDPESARPRMVSDGTSAWLAWLEGDDLQLAGIAACDRIEPLGAVRLDRVVWFEVAARNGLLHIFWRSSDDSSVIRVTTTTFDGNRIGQREIDFEVPFYAEVAGDGSVVAALRDDLRVAVASESAETWKVRLVDPLVPSSQRISGVAASSEALMISWSDAHGSYESLLRDGVLTELALAGTVAAANDEQFLLLEEGADSHTSVVGRFFAPDSTLTDPFLVSPAMGFSYGVQEALWAGTNFLVFRAPDLPSGPTTFPGLIYVASVLPSGATSEILLHDERGTMLDAACRDDACFAVWNSWDWRAWHNPFPGGPDDSFLAAAPVSPFGMPPASEQITSVHPEPVVDAAAAPLGPAWGVFSVANGDLRFDLVDEHGETFPHAAVPAAENQPLPAVDSIPIGEHALVVWDAGGDLVGRFAGAEGWISSPFPLVATQDQESRPHLVAVGERRFLVYERVASEALAATRIFVRELAPRERRRLAVRPSD